MEILLLLVLGPILLIIGLAVPMFLMERAVHAVHTLFPHLDKERSKNVVETAVIISWLIAGVVVSVIFFPDA